MSAMATQTETHPPCNVALIHHSGAKSPLGHKHSSTTLCQSHTSPVGLESAMHRGKHGAPEEPGGCDGSAEWLWVLREHFMRKQKQLAQQNNMYTGGLSEEPSGNLLFLGGESRRQLSLLLSPPAPEHSKSPKP